jgi:hypothetical protein
LTLDVQKVRGSGHGISIYFHRLSPKTFCWLGLGVFENKGYELYFQTNGNGSRGGETHRDNWVWRGIDEGRWYAAKIEVRKGNIKCYLDNKLILSESNHAFSRGRVGLGTGKVRARFRRIKLTAPDGRVLFEGLPDPRPPAPDARAPVDDPSGRRAWDPLVRVTANKQALGVHLNDALLVDPLTVHEDGDKLLADGLAGRADVICTHPLAADKPATIDFGRVTCTQSGTLDIFAIGYKNPNSNGGLVIIKKDGVVVQKKVIRDAGRWERLEVPFDKNKVELEHHALGWDQEFLFFDYSFSARSGADGSLADAGDGPRDEPPGAGAQGWVPLFNGKDLAGWKVAGAPADRWSIADGAIAASKAKTWTRLDTVRTDFANFRLRFETRLTEGPDCAVDVRLSESKEAGGFYSASVAGSAPNDVWTGEIQHWPLARKGPVTKATPMPVAPGEWFPVEIVADGDTITSIVKGRRVARYLDPKRSLPSGAIALFARANAAFSIRKIEIKELPASSGGGSPAAAKPRVPSGPQAGLASVTFRQGDDDYVGVSGLNYFGSAKPEEPKNPCLWADWPDAGQQGCVATLRFDDLFAPRAGRIPPGSRITAAKLRLVTRHDASGHGARLHRLKKPIDFNDVVKTLLADAPGDRSAILAASAAEVGGPALQPIVEPGPIELDVTADVAAWAAGAANHGWAFLPWPNGTDGWGFLKPDCEEVTDRPSLTITYLPPATAPPPGDAGGSAARAGEGLVVGRWTGNPMTNRFFIIKEDHTITGQDGKVTGTWSLLGTRLSLRWPNKDAPGGAWIDECEVTPDGTFAQGKNQVGRVTKWYRVK